MLAYRSSSLASSTRPGCRSHRFVARLLLLGACTLPGALAAQDDRVGSYAPIVAERHSGKCIDIEAARTTSGTPALQWACHGGAHQDLRLEPVGTGYRLRARHSGMCLGVAGASTQRGSAITQVACSTNASQIWTLDAGAADTRLRVAHSGQCLDIESGSRDNGARLIQWPCHTGTNQRFRVGSVLPSADPAPEPEPEPEPVPQPDSSMSAWGAMTSRSNGSCLDVFGGGIQAGAGLIQWGCHGGENQQFRIERVGERVRLRVRHSSLCVAVAGDSTESGAAIVQASCTDESARLWTITGEVDDASLRVAHTGQCLDIEFGSSAPGTRLIQWPCHGGLNQRFVLSADASNDGSKGFWQGPYATPLVAVTAANLPDGRILTWSAYDRFAFGGNQGRTRTAIFDPATGRSTEALVDSIEHDMFCPGTSMLADGRILVNGGSSSERTSLYDPATNRWSRGSAMQTARGYQANTVLADGSVLTLGGSWSGGIGGKGGEIWTSSGGWRDLPNLYASSLLTADRQGEYRSDNHMWLFTAPNGRVLHAGPARELHWLDTDGIGAVTAVGTRGADADAMNGTAVMFDVGRILTSGGAPHYQDAYASSRAYVIDVQGDAVATRQVGSMRYARGFHNSVVLPSGEVLTIGGQARPVPFSDADSVLEAELFDPDTESFRPMATMRVPRNYHSIAILLADGRVLSMGGGLCGGCDTNHADAEIFTPPYLLERDGTPRQRPTLAVSKTQLTHGQRLEVTVGGTDAPRFALVRTSAVTHSVNNDQRRIPLTADAMGGGRFALRMPTNPAVAIPGNYMLFALDDRKTPSVARLVNVR